MTGNTFQCRFCKYERLSGILENFYDMFKYLRLGQDDLVIKIPRVSPLGIYTR